MATVVHWQRSRFAAYSFPIGTGPFKERNSNLKRKVETNPWTPSQTIRRFCLSLWWNVYSWHWQVALAVRLLPSEETERVLIFYLYSVGRRGREGNIHTFQTAAVRKPHEIEVLLQFILKTSVLICSIHTHKRIIHRESRSASCSRLRGLNSSTLAHDLSLHVWKIVNVLLKIVLCGVVQF